MASADATPTFGLDLESYTYLTDNGGLRNLSNTGPGIIDYTNPAGINTSPDGFYSYINNLGSPAASRGVGADFVAAPLSPVVNGRKNFNVNSGGLQKDAGNFFSTDDNIIYESYAGIDITAEIILPDQKMVLGELQTISYSIHRENTPIRFVGHVNVMGFVKGPRCLPASTIVFIKDKGPISIADVKLGDYVQTTGSEFNKVLGSFDQGVKRCLEMRLANGYKLVGSYDHPISTSEGWKKLEDISLSDKIDVAVLTPSHDDEFDIDDDIIKMIALLIGDGRIHTYSKANGSIEHRISLAIAFSEMNTIGKETERILKTYNIPFRDSNINNGSLDRVISVCVDEMAKTDWRQRKYNLLHEWLVKFDMYGMYSHTKRIPQEFLVHLSRRQIVVFLQYLFATDGEYSISKDTKYISAQYDSTSEELIDQIRILLSKIGVPALKAKQAKVGQLGGKEGIVSRHDSYRLTISNAKDLLKFITRIGIFGKDDRIEQYIPMLRRRMRDDVIGMTAKEFFGLANNIVKRDNLDRVAIKRTHQIYNYKLDITPYRALHLADDLADEEFSESMNDLIDELLNKDDEFVYLHPISIKEVGELQVYDLEVEDRHSFIADFIKVHNTIAGSLIFTTFNTYAFYRLARLANLIETDNSRVFPLGDMLPPFDIVLSFSNESGSFSKMKILGVTIVDEGGTMSVDDLISEQTFSYMARGIEPIHRYIPDNLDTSKAIKLRNQNNLSFSPLGVRYNA